MDEMPQARESVCGVVAGWILESRARRHRPAKREKEPKWTRRLSEFTNSGSPSERGPLREPSPGGLLLTDKQRSAGGREAGDGAGQWRLRRRRPGRFPTAVLERLPVGDAELRGHHVRPRSADRYGLLALGRGEHSRRRHRAAYRRRRRVRLGAPAGRLSAPERRPDGVLR